MHLITGFFGFLWRLARIAWPFSGSGQSFSGAGTVWTFLFFLFFIFFAVAWLFGFSPSEVSAWIDSHAALWRWIGDWAFRLFCGFVLLICAYAIVGGAYEAWSSRTKAAVVQHRRRKEDRAEPPRGFGCFGYGVAVVIGYFAWVGMVMPFD